MNKEPKMHQAYYDISKLVIWGDGGDSGKRARMAFSFRDGNPRLVVYTGETGPGGVLTFPSDYLTFGAFLETLKKISEGENGVKYPIESLTAVYEDNKPTDQTRVLSTVYAGKSKDGVVYLSVIMEGKPKLVFQLKPSVYHRFYGEDKNPLPDSEVSKMMTASLVKFMYGIMNNVLVQHSNEVYESGARKTSPIKGFGAPETGKAKSKATDDLMGDLDDLAL